MYPWFWFWAPQVHFPWSGNVAQDIEPDTRWFFGAIRPNAGNAKVERRAFDIATYGKQIGLLTEVLLSQHQPSAVTPEQGAKALASLAEIRSKIETVKLDEAQILSKSLEEQLHRLRSQHPDEFQRLAQVFE